MIISKVLREEILTKGNIPKHVAIIMDGNGRWADQKNRPRVWGHYRGVESVKASVRAAAQLGLDTLTLYAFSMENWGRPKKEIDTIFELLNRFIVKERDELKRNNIRFSTIGDISYLPQRSQDNIDETKKILSSNTGMLLNVALSYGSRQEITQACRDIAHNAVKGTIDPKNITIETIQSHLFTADLADPDLLIRTSGEQRISNFLLWQLAYSEIWFSPVFWPDFREEHFYQGVQFFQSRTRRYGLLDATKENISYTLGTIT